MCGCGRRSSVAVEPKQAHSLDTRKFWDDAQQKRSYVEPKMKVFVVAVVNRQEEPGGGGGVCVCVCVCTCVGVT